MSKRQQIVPWDFDVPEGMRDEIIHEYVTKSYKGTDSKYLKEYSRLRSQPYSTCENDTKALADALNAQSLQVASIMTAQEFMGQGGGNFRAIIVEQTDQYYTTSLCVSGLGKYISHDLLYLHGDLERWYQWPLTDEQICRIERCKDVAINMGYIWLDDELLYKTVPKLLLKHFGTIKEWYVRDLLYYWED